MIIAEAILSVALAALAVHRAIEIFFYEADILATRCKKPIRPHQSNGLFLWTRF
jgi:hypothetical protein